MDIKALEKALSQARPRQKEVPVPALAPYLDMPDGETPVWTVRNLTAAELAWAEKGQERSEALEQLVRAFASGDGVSDAVREFMGLDATKPPPEFTRQIDFVVAGTVSPAITADNRGLIVLLSEKQPGTFRMLFNEIQRLTGLGAEPGKPKSSGKAPACATP